jgi:UDP-3-O-[3-hydroxymyristoyl] glucosamine N-acyltransferase
LNANHLILNGIEPHREGIVENGACSVGRARIGKGSVTAGSSAVRGQSMIRENCRISPNAHI